MITQRIREIAETRVRYGYERIHVLLRREGWLINHKKTYRIYCQEGLHLRRKRPRRHVSGQHRMQRDPVFDINQCWSMDFVADNLFNGQRFRALTVVDNFSRECLMIHIAASIKGEHVVMAMEELRLLHGRLPAKIRTDNGSEFISRALDKWAYEQGVILDFSRPGTPTDNAYIESFNGKLRDECLNTHWFLSMDDARNKIEAWREDYNRERPHSSLGYMTPSEFVRNHQQAMSTV